MIRADRLLRPNSCIKGKGIDTKIRKPFINGASPVDVRVALLQRGVWMGLRWLDACRQVRRWAAPHVAATILVTVSVPLCVHAQSVARCDASRRVRTVAFAGSPHFADAMMAGAIVTRGGSLISRILRRGLPCIDTLEVRRDALRIAVLHRQAGWFLAAVTPRIIPNSKGLGIVFDITPGVEAKLDTVSITGLPPTPAGRAPFDVSLRALKGKRFDRVKTDSVVEAVVARLRDVGYARAGRPANRIVIDTATAKVALSLAFALGQRLTIGAIHVSLEGIDTVRTRVDSAGVMSLIDLRVGKRYSAAGIVDAQRDLYRTDAFRLVLIDTVVRKTPAATGADSLIDLRISLAEARTRNARVGLGWATQDCIRVQGRITDRSFLGVGRRVELNARASKIGVGSPVGFAPGLCSAQVRTDQFSRKLNYYLGTTLSSSRFFGRAVSPVVTVYTERRSEPEVYLRETAIGALFELSTQFDRRLAGTVGFQYENGKTITDPAVSCTRFAQCRPEDYVLSFFGRSIGIINSSLSFDRTNDAVNPTNGGRTRVEVRAGQTSSQIVSSLRFYRTSGEGTAYFPLFNGTFATRVQLSRAFAPGAPLVDGSPLIPQQERLFAGGQNSVRGYQQNLLGALVYVVKSVNDSVVAGIPVVVATSNTKFDVVPRGGTALFVANFEYRHGARWISNQLQLATFVDVGDVWEAHAGGFHVSDLRATPGVGLRLVTPLGPFRVDIGYSPYEPRAGRALYFTPRDSSGNFGQIQCASPGNRVSIDPNKPGDIFTCPSTFRPSSSRGVLSRLAFHFGLGQAF